MSTIWIVGGVVVLLAGIAARVRRARYGTSMLTDEHSRGIEGTGRLELADDEPLDLTEVQEEEERFWAETWDEPEEL